MDAHVPQRKGMAGLKPESVVALALSKEEFNPACTLCPRLAQYLADCKANYPAHFAAPVPPFGQLSASLLVVGLAPGYHGANRTGRPFTGDFCGDLLYQTLHRYGFASAPVSVAANDSLKLINCRVTNAVKCVPPENKPTPAEIRLCNNYLKNELRLHPPKVILALGLVAHEAVLIALGLKKSQFKFAHAAEYDLNGAGHPFMLMDSYHVSRYNTQTGRLTTPMFEQVVARARILTGLSQ
ncbi:MAG: uracil-DNA glycosylase [Burkholderiales bacterium]|nr:uracil-DNA glycosylase [Burkholderiales bacterium]